MANMLGTQRGYRTLPSTLDYLAEHNPTKVYASIPLTRDIDDGFRDVTVLEVSCAIHACSHWLADTFGTSNTFETLTYVGVNDLRYTIFLYTAMKCGYKALFISPRNTIEQNTSLMKQTQSQHIFYSSEFKALSEKLPGSEKLLFKTWDFWLGRYSKLYPFTKSFEEVRDGPVVVLHSSGSTGNPKPITHTHNFFATTERPLPPVLGREAGSDRLIDFEGGGSVLYPFPPFHATGLVAQCAHPVFSSSATLVLPLPDRPITAEQVSSIMKQKSLRMLVLPPSIIEALVQNPEILAKLKKLETLLFGGAPLSQPVGDMLSQHMNLVAAYGSTELGALPQLKAREQGDWSWFEWHPAINVTMEPVADGTYELVLYEDLSADEYRCGSSIVKKHRGFRTKDLFLPHPTKSGLWQFQVRTDDIIVFSNGEKWFPIPSEGVLMSHPKVKGAMIVGNGRFEAAALVEANSNLTVEELWPTVEIANSRSQKHGHISKSKIAILPEGSFIRSPKGSIIRRISAEENRDVIEQLYDNTPKFVKPVTRAETPAIVEKVIHSIPVLENISEQADFFAFGIDSLQVLEIVRKLHRAGVPGVTSAVVFANSSIKRLSHALCADISMQVDLNSVLERYKSQIVRNHRQCPAQTVQRLVLTGSTGSLGREILLYLRALEGVDVTCLNRSEPTELLPGVRYLKADLAKAGLGLSPEELHQLESADVIIHNAWKVDFNHRLVSFEPLLQGLINLCNLGPRVIFVGSGSAVWDCDTITVPEACMDDPVVAPSDSGYGQSKYIAERLLVYVPGSTVLRVGQIAASTKPGSEPWNAREWFPSLLKTSKNLGYLPLDLPARIDWVPRDVTAQAIVDLTLLGNEGVYNIFNPHQRMWADVFPTIESQLGVEGLPLKDWVALLETKIYEDVETYPALRLLSYFEEVKPGPRFDTKRAVSDSVALANLGEISDEWIEKWIDELGLRKM